MFNNPLSHPDISGLVFSLVHKTNPRFVWKYVIQPALALTALLCSPNRPALAEQTPTNSGGSDPTKNGPLELRSEIVWRRPSPPTAWQITFKSFSASPDPTDPNAPLSVSVTRLEKDSLELVQYPNRTLEIWKIADRTFLSTPESNDVTLRLSDSRTPDSPTGRAANIPQDDPDWIEMSEFNWITPEMYKGKISIDGEDMLIYSDIDPQRVMTSPKGKAGTKPNYPSGPLGGLPLIPGVKVAAVSEETKLPRYLQTGMDLSIYTFTKPAIPKLELPSKVARLTEPRRTIAKGQKFFSMVP